MWTIFDCLVAIVNVSVSKIKHFLKCASQIYHYTPEYEQPLQASVPLPNLIKACKAQKNGRSLFQCCTCISEKLQKNHRLCGGKRELSKTAQNLWESVTRTLTKTIIMLIKVLAQWNADFFLSEVRLFSRRTQSQRATHSSLQETGKIFPSVSATPGLSSRDRSVSGPFLTSKETGFGGQFLPHALISAETWVRFFFMLFTLLADKQWWWIIFMKSIKHQ